MIDIKFLDISTFNMPSWTTKFMVWVKRNDHKLLDFPNQLFVVEGQYYGNLHLHRHRNTAIFNSNLDKTLIIKVNDVIELVNSV